MKIENDISKDNTLNENLSFLSTTLDALYYHIESATDSIDEVNDGISTGKLDKKNKDVMELITKYERITNIYKEFIESANRTDKILKEG